MKSLQGLIVLVALVAGSPAPAADQVTAEQMKQARDLMTKLCHGMIINFTCMAGDRITVLGADGKLHDPKTDQWQPAFGGGYQTYIPSKQPNQTP